MKAWGSKKIFRREELPPLEPWQVDHFGGASVQRPHLFREEPPPPPEYEPTIVAEEPDAGVPEPEPAGPTAPMIGVNELEALKTSARDEGFQAGHAAGQEAGYAEGEQAGREAGYAAGFEAGQQKGRDAANAEVARFQALLAHLDAAVVGYETGLAKPILDIALAVARQMLRGTLAAEPERVLTVIRDAINALPELQGPLRLELHPDDLALVQTLLGGETTPGNWRLEPNPDIERGGCRIGNANVEVDLTLATRWQRVVESLGRQDGWGGGS
ncbi:flagellar assembly protein FliH [Chitinimonas koreensis]|uniref:flagellar assembly protein FliH n=1 Tax=Chitinimonas koreensis TaxID=356302 RepID=UPI00040692FC|nr:flagellar assembly protein FliH [Chitinimonas koreensis]QNM98288.1 flagellar assembly protein FliH [Chitinimonas koreensis]